MTASRLSVRKVRRLLTLRRAAGALLALVGSRTPGTRQRGSSSSSSHRGARPRRDGQRDWILALGSDARPGQPVLGSRSDAIQLVGINTVTHHGVTIGVPRDSYVDIPGVGRDKINAAMVYGGAQLRRRRWPT